MCFVEDVPNCIRNETCRHKTLTFRCGRLFEVERFWWVFAVVLETRLLEVFGRSQVAFALCATMMRQADHPPRNSQARWLGRPRFPNRSVGIRYRFVGRFLHRGRRFFARRNWNGRVIITPHGLACHRQLRIQHWPPLCTMNSCARPMITATNPMV